MLSPLFLADENEVIRLITNDPKRNNQPFPPSAESSLLYLINASKKLISQLRICVTIDPTYITIGTSIAAIGSTYRFKKLNRVSSTTINGTATNNKYQAIYSAPPKPIYRIVDIRQKAG
jgi:hypothetical protein